MNANAQFVKWVKDRYPHVLAVAARRVGQKNALGGLGDNLIGDVAVDTSDISIDPSVSAAIDQAASSGFSSSWSDIIDSLAGAIGTVAPQIVQTKADLATIQINQQRALNNQSILARGSLLSGQGLTGSTPLLLIGGLLVGGFVLLQASRKRK